MGTTVLFNCRYGYVTPDDVPELLDQQIAKGEIIHRIWRYMVSNSYFYICLCRNIFLTSTVNRKPFSIDILCSSVNIFMSQGFFLNLYRFFSGFNILIFYISSSNTQDLIPRVTFFMSNMVFLFSKRPLFFKHLGFTT